MADLIELTPCDGLLPLTIGQVRLVEVTPERIISVAPFAGQQKAVSTMLKDQLGVALPANNRRNKAVQWFGHGVWLVYGDAALDGKAAVTDQSDAWAIVAISGNATENVLARLVPIDLRAAHFKAGHTARTMLGHMSVAISRKDADTFEIMAMRSMARTLVHELETAARGVAAR